MGEDDNSTGDEQDRGKWDLPPDDDEKIRIALSGTRDPPLVIRDIVGEMTELREKARAWARKRLRGDAEIIRGLVSLMKAAFEFEPIDYWEFISKAIPDTTSGPNVSHAAYARDFARHVVPADPDGRFHRADLFGAAAYELAYWSYPVAKVIPLLMSGCVTIEWLAMEGRKRRRPAYTPQYEGWQAPVAVKVSAAVARQMFLLSRFRPGLGKSIGMAIWRQLPGPGPSRLFEIYSLYPPVGPKHQDQMARAFQSFGGGRLVHPKLRRLGIK